MITTPATVVLVSPDMMDAEHGRAILFEGVWRVPVGSPSGLGSCKTTLHTNGRPTLCDCGQVLYKVDEAMDEPCADGETVG